MLKYSNSMRSNSIFPCNRNTLGLMSWKKFGMDLEIKSDFRIYLRGRVAKLTTLHDVENRKVCGENGRSSFR